MVPFLLQLQDGQLFPRLHTHLPRSKMNHRQTCFFYFWNINLSRLRFTAVLHNMILKFPDYTRPPTTTALRIYIMQITHKRTRYVQSHLFQTLTLLLLLALRLLLQLSKILKLQLGLLLTLRKLPSNSYQKDSVYFASWSKILYVVSILPLFEQNWLKWSHEKHNTEWEWHNTLRFSVMLSLSLCNIDKHPVKL